MGFTIKTNRPTLITMGGYTRYPLSNGRYLWYDSLGKPLTKEIGVNDWILKPDGTRVRTAVRRANRRAAIQAAKTLPITGIPSSIAFAPWNQEPYMDQEEEIVNPAVTSTTKQQSDTTTTKTGKTNKAAIRSKITPKGQAYWDNQYKNFLDEMTDDLKAWLALRGIDYSSAEKMQEYLLGIGKSVGRFGADNKWGSDSQAAWNDLVNTTMKNNPLQTTVEEPEPILDLPDPFGYSTTNHYGNGMTLKELGFNNYSGLKNYVIANLNNQFAKDLKQRFGNDVNAWNQTDVENALGVSGTYRGGYAGDFGDMARSMAKWAGLTNAAYDTRKETSVAKPTFNTQEMLNNVKSLKFTTPEWKFSLNQGNIGVSTLGNLPSTKPESNNLDWMKYAQQTGYLPTE